MTVQMQKKKDRYMQGLDSIATYSLDHSDSVEEDFIFEMFGGKETMEKEFPIIYQLEEQTRNQHQCEYRSQCTESYPDQEHPFTDAWVSWNGREGTLGIYGALNLKARAQFALLMFRIYQDNNEIACIRNHSFHSFYANIDQELKLKKDLITHATYYMTAVWAYPGENTLNSCISSGKLDGKSDGGAKDGGEECYVDLLVVHEPLIRHQGKPNFPGVLVSYGREDMKRIAEFYYDLTPGNYQKISLPIKGYVNFSKDSAVYKEYIPQNSKVYLTDKKGKWYFHNDLAKAVITPYPDSRSFSFELPVDWANNSLLKNDLINGTAFELNMSLAYRGTDNVIYKVRFHSMPHPRSYMGGDTQEIDMIYLIWGCMGKNTMVEEKKKGKVFISQIEIGDCVRTLGDDTYGLVSNVWIGTEEKIWNIETEGGLLVQLTKTHPILTRNGWKAADELMGSDELLLEDGTYDHLMGVYPSSYHDKVYNLEVDGFDGFWGSGCLVGDFKKQNTMDKDREQEKAWEPLSKELDKECMKFVHLYKGTL